MRYRALIFDLFGTLVAGLSLGEFERVLSEMAAACSAPRDEFARLWSETRPMRTTGFFASKTGRVPAEGIFDSVEANIRHICRTLGVQLGADHLTAAAHIRLDFTRRALTPRRNAVETLAQVKARGYRTGLISNCSPEVPMLWRHTPLAPLVDVPIFSCAAGLKKPDLCVYGMACERLDVRPPDCLYLADGEGGELAAASQVGMHSVLICASPEDADDAYRIDPEEWHGPTISALKDVLTLIE